MQLLGFNYKAAIGEPLSELCANKTRQFSETGKARLGLPASAISIQVHRYGPLKGATRIRTKDAVPTPSLVNRRRLQLGAPPTPQQTTPKRMKIAINVAQYHVTTSVT